MSKISLKIEVPERPELVKFSIAPSVIKEFELYVRAAQEGSPEITKDAVIEAIISRQIDKDRKFKEWKKNYLQKEYPEDKEKHGIE